MVSCLRAAAAAVLLACAAAPAAAQSSVGIPFERRDAFVLAFSPPYRTILLDLGESVVSTEFAVEAAVGEGTVLADSRGAPLDPSAIRPGMEVAVAGERHRDGVVLASLRLRTRIEDWRFEVDGVLERVEDGVAVVDGRRVALAPGTAVRGGAEWRRRQFRTLAELPLGTFVTGRGSRGPDGLVRLTAAEASPNLFTNTERALEEVLRQGLVPPTELSGGRMRIGSDEFRLVQDLQLQAYVTRIGLRLVPAWMNELPDDDPAKVEFRFYVIDDPSFNAMAFPDGSVLVHTGLLRVLDSEAQLAAVLGHEIGHVTHEHGRERFESGRRRSILGRAAGAIATTAGVEVPAVEVGGVRIDLAAVARLGEGALSNSYGRAQEAQADRVGLAYMVDAGYDPREAAIVWRRIAEANRPGNALAGVLERADTFLFSSHPAAIERARSIHREVAANHAELDAAGFTVGEAEYRQATASLR